jgi:hypothetical protein
MRRQRLDAITMAHAESQPGLKADAPREPTMTHQPHIPDAQAGAGGGLFVVAVREQRTRALVGSDGQSYTSPPQTEQQARQLATLLAERPVDGPGPWRQPIAGGQRTIELQRVGDQP